MSCHCGGDRDGEIRAIAEYLRDTRVWSSRRAFDRAEIEYAKGYRLAGFPPRLVLVQELSDREVSQ